MFQKRSLVALGMSLALVAGQAQAEGKLSIYHWFEYIPQELLDDFSAKYDVCLLYTSPSPRDRG